MMKEYLTIGEKGYAVIGPEYLERIAQLLLRYGIVQSISDEMMQSAMQELRRHATEPYLQKCESPTCLLEGLVPFLREAPFRFIWFDAEMNGSSYAELVRQFAEATGGEWVPQQVMFDIAPGEGANSYRMTLSVEVGGELVHGEWTTQSLGWVEDDGFVDVMRTIAEAYLLGEFVEIPMHDQTMLFMYLPKPLVRDLETLLDQLEQEYPNFAIFARTFPEQEMA